MNKTSASKFLFYKLVVVSLIFSSIVDAQESRTRRRVGAGEVRKRDGQVEIKHDKESPASADTDVESFKPNVYDSIPNKIRSSSEFVAAPDRWRMIYQGKWYDPYNQNILKGDIPVFGKPGKEWFFEATILSDTLIEHRKVPTPVGIASTNSSQSNNIFGNYEQTMVVENLLTQFSLIKGNTVFKPPDFELRIAPVFNLNHVNLDESGITNVNPGAGTHRDDAHIGFQ